MAYGQASGTLYFSQDSNANGLYRINTGTGLATLDGSGISGVTSSTVGLSESADPTRLYGSSFSTINYVRTDGSGVTPVGPAAAEGLGFDPQANVLYGAINGSFFTINTVTGAQQTTLASPPGGADIEGLAWGGPGVVYGLAGFSGPRGNLYRYAIASNTWSLVGFSGVQFNLPGLAYNTTTGLLYAVGAQDPNLYTINPVTGVASVVGSTGLTNTGGGLAFVNVPEPATLTAAFAVVLGLAARRRR